MRNNLILFRVKKIVVRGKYIAFQLNVRWSVPIGKKMTKINK